jgi:hypothetical protein
MRYQKIESKIWNDEKFIALTPMQQRLFFYVLTSPHNNLVGMYVLKAGYACEDLNISNKDFGKDLKALCDSELIQYDKTLKVLFIVNFLRHNPITNPNQKKAAVKLLNNLPRTQLIQVFLDTYEGLAKELVNSLNLVLLKPETETEAGTEEETGKQKKKKYGTNKNVLLTDKEKESLKKKFGEAGAKEWVETLSNGMMLKNYGYTSHYHAILKWSENKQGGNGTSPIPTTKQPCKVCGTTEYISIFGGKCDECRDKGTTVQPRS